MCTRTEYTVKDYRTIKKLEALLEKIREVKYHAEEIGSNQVVQTATLEEKRIQARLKKLYEKGVPNDCYNSV